MTKNEIKNRHPHHDLTQTCMGSKYICPVLIYPTENFLTHPKKSFRINERWTSKWKTQMSTMNRRRLKQRTWMIFYIKQSDKFMQTSLNTQPSPSPQTSTNLWMKQIRMSSLYTANKKFTIHPRTSFSINELWFD